MAFNLKIKPLLHHINSNILNYSFYLMLLLYSISLILNSYSSYIGLLLSPLFTLSFIIAWQNRKKGLYKYIFSILAFCLLVMIVLLTQMEYEKFIPLVYIFPILYAFLLLNFVTFIGMAL